MRLTPKRRRAFVAAALLAPGLNTALARADERWLEARSEHFRVYTNGSEKDGRTVLTGFARPPSSARELNPSFAPAPALLSDVLYRATRSSWTGWPRTTARASVPASWSACARPPRSIPTARSRS